MTAPKKHFPELDGLRGVAVLGVMLYHFLQFQPIDASPAGLLVKCSRLGQTGVDLFFVLSGFLITGILLDSRQESHYFRNFYARRTLRIFPLHYAALILFFFVFLPIRGQPIPPLHVQFWGWAYLVNIPMTLSWAVQSLPGHFWSLAVEEHFYFVWPLIVWLAPTRWLVAISLLFIPIAIASRLVMHAYGLAEFYFTLCRTDSLAIGALAVILFRWPRLSASMMNRTLVMAAIICIPLWIILGGAGIFAVAFARTLIAIAYAVLLLSALMSAKHSWIKRLFTSRVLRFFGKYSYALYVFHAMIPFPWQWADFRSLIPSTLGAMLAMCVTYGLISILAALLSWNLLEKHCLRLKRFFEFHTRPAHLAPVLDQPPDASRTNDASEVPAP